MLTDIPGRDDDLIMTFNYTPTTDLQDGLHTENPDGEEYPPSGQVLYSKDEPYTAIDFTPEPAESWGGIIEYDGDWIFPEQECSRFARLPTQSYDITLFFYS